jgi:hypothetical protein
MKKKQKGSGGLSRKKHAAGALCLELHDFRPSSGLRIDRSCYLGSPFPPRFLRQWVAWKTAPRRGTTVPDYSGGPATELHRVPKAEAEWGRILAAGPGRVKADGSRI